MHARVAKLPCLGSDALMPRIRRIGRAPWWRWLPCSLVVSIATVSIATVSIATVSIATVSIATVLIATVLIATVAAQVPPGAAPPTDVSSLDAEPAVGSPAAARWQLGREALQQGDGGAALPHLLAVLEFHQDQPRVLADIVRAAPDADVRALWLERLVRAAADVQGRFEPEPALRRLLDADDLAAARKLAQLRAQAAVELARALDRCKGTGKAGLGNGAVARWLATVFVTLGGDAPALLRAHGPAFTAALQRDVPEWDLVGKALLEVAQGRMRLANGLGTATAAPAAERDRRLDLALRAARLLRGLARQTRFGKDLRGATPPDLSSQAAAAMAAETAARAALGEPRCWTIDELGALDAPARVAFTLAHRTWAEVGVATSTTGKYRVETICGFETLLGAAQTVEFHHARLVAHFGADPFAGRPGTIVVVPEVADLETEGAPHWWAQGFQGGDRTVVRFAWDRISGLGHLLTHELTHRFDSVLRPFQRPWYGEGHASWTGGHYAGIDDAEFTRDYLDVGAAARTWYAGYGDEAKLRQLLAGTLADYRDNYFAGYALYAYLRGHPPQAPPRFAEALARFEANARGGQQDPVGYFTKVFCDGKAGRPADLAAFVADWREFLQGCARWQDERTRDASNAWVGRYGRLADQKPTDLVLDEPTLSWGRTRAEPWFGQGHAGAAGEVLAAAGSTAGAAAAYLWSLQCEGWQARTTEGAIAALRQGGGEEAAAALQQLGHVQFPAVIAGGEASVLLARLPRLRAYLDALAAAAASRSGDHLMSAATLAAEHERLLALCGSSSTATDAAPAIAVGVAPLPVPRALGAFGFVEDELTDYDDQRTANLWFTTPAGDLHVGRERPTSSTGGFERQALQRSTYVRASDWVPAGEHVVRMRIHFTTSFVAGAVDVGHWRRDRGVRLSFSAGSSDYATGRSEVATVYDGVWLGLHGLWERDGPMPETAPTARVVFAEPAGSFALELRIHGPSLTVLVDGEVQFRYATPDGAPIAGHVGFAARQGAYRVQQPTVQRLDGARSGQTIAAVAAVGLDVDAQPTEPIDDLERRPTRGIPLAPVGTLVLWLPAVPADEDPGAGLPRALPVLAKVLRDVVEYPQVLVLAVPAGCDRARIDAAMAQVQAVRGSPVPVLEHHVGAPLLGNPWLLFVDAAGVLRAAGQVGDPRLHSAVQKWARLFRDR